MPEEHRSQADPGIAARLTAARKRAGMTQEDAVEALHLLTGEEVGRDTLSQWECARRTISIRRLVQLAEVYGVRPSYLLEGDEAAAPELNPEYAELVSRLSRLDGYRKARALESISAILDTIEDENVEVKILTLPLHSYRH